MYNLVKRHNMTKERFVNLWLATYNAAKTAGMFDECVETVDYDDFMEVASTCLDKEIVVNNTTVDFSEDINSELIKEESNIEKKEITSSIELSEKLLTEVDALLSSGEEYSYIEDESIFEINLDYSDIEDEFNGIKLISKAMRGKKGFQIGFSLDDLDYYNVAEDNLALI